MESAVLADISTRELREKANHWQRYHEISLRAEHVEARIEARKFRDGIGSELEALGYTPAFCDDGIFVLIVQ